MPGTRLRCPEAGSPVLRLSPGGHPELRQKGGPMEHTGCRATAIPSAEALLPQQPPREWLQPTGVQERPRKAPDVEPGNDAGRCPSMAKGVLQFTAETPECGEVQRLALTQQAPPAPSGGGHLQAPVAEPGHRPAAHRTASVFPCSGHPRFGSLRKFNKRHWC